MVLTDLVRGEVTFLRYLLYAIDAFLASIKIQVLVLQADGAQVPLVRSLGATGLALGVQAHVLPDGHLLAKAACVVVSSVDMIFWTHALLSHES